VLLYKALVLVITAVVVTVSVKVTAGINIAGVVDMKRHGATSQGTRGTGTTASPAEDR